MRAPAPVKHEGMESWEGQVGAEVAYLRTCRVAEFCQMVAERFLPILRLMLFWYVKMLHFCSKFQTNLKDFHML